LDFHACLYMDERDVRIGPSSSTAFAVALNMQPAFDSGRNDFTENMLDRMRMYRAHMYSLRMEADTITCYRAHIRFDETVTHLADMENRTRLLHRLSPGGPNQGVRKTLSYDGGLGPNHEYDPTNWYWSVLMKAFLYQLPNMSFGGSYRDLRWALSELNDSKLGDHWEAILGLEVWSRNDWRNTPHTTLLTPFMNISRNDIVEYASWINEAMHMLEHFIVPYLIRHRFIANVWGRYRTCTSRAAAAFLC
jgi:hypothetical protein